MMERITPLSRPDESLIYSQGLSGSEKNVKFSLATCLASNSPRGDQRSTTDKPHKNCAGLAAALDLAQSLGESVTGWDEGESPDWMWESYRDFRRAFRLAKNDGFVLFY